ncbi:MAG: UDP-N-acetylmuramoyl-tripeptide--D-alanyl-D-alanine ligase [Eubacterium sp.]|nr:UDP-N-acetylmuramoyl-tripeptide--D-alanyl-D-alanine ligase [Eubacterium sp.]
MKDMTLDAIAKACHGQLCGANTMQFLTARGVVIDSRMVQDDYLFVAISGERTDGHQYIEQAFSDGALAVITEKPLTILKPYILVTSTRQALKDLAAYYLSRLDLKVVGISGSVGKTSTKEIIASVLSQKYLVHKTAGNFNNEIGLPLTIFKLCEEHQVAVLEMGISDFGEMHRLAAVARPDIAVLTNIGLSHLKTLGSREGILKAKTEMFAHLKDDACVVLNGDDDLLCTITQVQGKPPVFYGIGTDCPPAALYGSKYAYATDIENLGLKGIRLTLHLGEDAFCVRIPIPGEHNVYNALAAASVGKQLGLTNDEIKAGIENARTIDGRTNLIETGNMIVIDDCYNANPLSMKASIDVLATALGRTIAVLGDMGDLGENERSLHYEVGMHLAKKGIDILFCAGTLSHEIARAVRDANPSCSVHEYETRDDLLKELLPFLQEGDSVLVKASHFMKYSDVVEAIITM